MQHYTTIEQSKKLVELGLSPDTADMHYLKIIRENDVRYIPELLLDDNECDIPCWSLGALLQSAPKCFSKENHQFVQTIQYDFITREYYFSYEDYQHGGRRKSITNSKDLFDGSFKMVVWLLENGYIKKGE